MSDLSAPPLLAPKSSARALATGGIAVFGVRPAHGQPASSPASKARASATMAHARTRRRPR